MSTTETFVCSVNTFSEISFREIFGDYSRFAEASLTRPAFLAQGVWKEGKGKMLRPNLDTSPF